MEELNSQRNAINAAIRKIALEHMKNHNDQLPPMQGLLDCLKRELPVTDENKPIILFYVDTLLPKFGGVGNPYGKNIRYYKRISEAISSKTSKKIDISEATEAFGVLICENSWARWMEEGRIKKEEPRAVGKQIHVLDDRKTTSSTVNPNKKFIAKMSEFPLLEPHYTIPHVGQKQYGGWSQKGIDRFVKLKKANGKARIKPHGIKWEKDVLAMLRKEFNITEDSYEAQRKIEGKQKRKSHLEPLTDVVGCLYVETTYESEEEELTAV